MSRNLCSRSCFCVALLLCLSPSLCLSLSASDCNGNGVIDGEDIATGQSEDCNGNSVPDECESSP
ncbi:MAG: hypothetical protein JXA90_15020, partial [Planctomycetes bacterium]|nr:hypothetical protein [Planctomycetota bacterium]